MNQVYMPVSAHFEAEHLREWRANAPWRLAGLAVMTSSAIGTTLLYIHLAKVTISAFLG